MQFGRKFGTALTRWMEKAAYCALHKHANSKVQKPPSQWLFSLPPIIITITSNEPWNTETHKTDRNSPITNQKAWPFEPVKVKDAFHSTKIPVWNFGNLRVQRNGTFRLHRPDPSHRALGYCSCKQDTKERYWGQQFCQMERNISVRPTEMTRPVKEDHLQSWSRMFRSDQTEMVRSIWCSNRNYQNFGWMESAQSFVS